jgi:DNA modification methylase
MKPVELIQRCLGNSVPYGGCVVDLFMGSGSTLIAAELMQRRAVGTEIDSRYADVIIGRWQLLTAKEATLENANSATFAHVKEGRRLEAEDAIKEEVLEMTEECTR